MRDPIHSSDAVLAPARVVNTVSIALKGGLAPMLSVFEGLADGRDDHVSLTFPLGENHVPLVRIHSSCVTGDIFGSQRCDCGPQLDEALRRCAATGGALLYLNQEGRGIGLAAKIAAYQLQDEGLDTFAANRQLGYPDDLRDYRVAAQMLRALGMTRIRLLSNNPDKAAQLQRWGIAIEAVEPTSLFCTPQNGRYLRSKHLHGHTLSMAGDEQ